MTTNQTAQKQQVRDLLRAIETGDSGPIATINPNKYVQHNLAVKEGLSGFGAFLGQIPKGTARVDTFRLFQDGNLVFAHSEYSIFAAKVAFDVFRFEDRKIVEHWDNIQAKSPNPNPSGHTMTDGQTEARDLEKTEANKRLVRSFVEDIVNGRMEKLGGYFDGDRYTQHNPQIGDGLSGFRAGLKAMAENGVTMKYDHIRRVAGEGNFVLTVCEGQLGGKLVSFYDLFRVENGKLAEHWDVIQDIPPKDQWKNSNGKF
jgi:predicted SnoaL-like aldol condensation-catalyzing enzyme